MLDFPIFQPCLIDYQRATTFIDLFSVLENRLPMKLFPLSRHVSHIHLVVRLQGHESAQKKCVESYQTMETSMGVEGKSAVMVKKLQHLVRLSSRCFPNPTLVVMLYEPVKNHLAHSKGNPSICHKQQEMAQFQTEVSKPSANPRRHQKKIEKLNII
jgi:hypothetical protein